MAIEPWLQRASERVGTRTAVETPDGSLSYAELERASGATAVALGVEAGARVAIALPGGVDFAIALHACLRAGAIAVPVDVRLAAPERERIAAGCDLVVSEAPPREGAGGPVWRSREADDIAVIIHTSGTSGAPKPVPLSYGNWLWSAIGSATALGLDAEERWLCALPVAHVGGLSILLRSCIYGTTAVVHDRFDCDRVLAALHGGTATAVSLVPTTLARLLEAGLSPQPALRCLLLGGAGAAPSLVREARERGLPVSETYGLTEACSQVATQSPSLDAGAGAPPLFCTRVRIALQDGEIFVSGPTVTPAAGEELATGDLGELDPAGRLQVTGRKSEVIVSGGENVAPAEVEAVLGEHPAVSEVAVIGISHPEWGEAVRAVVVLGAEASAEELRAHCAARLAPFKVPKEVLFVRELPRTASGKLERVRLAREGPDFV